jgi:hypothetical protein
MDRATVEPDDEKVVDTLHCCLSPSQTPGAAEVVNGGD